MTEKKQTCKNCGTEFTGKYCPECGQSASVERFAVKETFKGLYLAFSVGESTFYKTALSLFTRPGHMIREYLIGQRVRYLKPVKMLMVLVAVYLIFSHWIESGESAAEVYVKDEVSKLSFLGSATDYVIRFFQNNVYVSLVQALLFTFTFTWVFRKCKITFLDGTQSSLNMAEHFYALVFISCQAMILAFLEVLSRVFFGYQPDGMESLLIYLLLYAWTYKQLLSISWAKSLWKVFLGFLLLMTVLILLVIITIFLIFFINPSLANSIPK